MRGIVAIQDGVELFCVETVEDRRFDEEGGDVCVEAVEDFFDDVCGRAPEPSERGVLRSAYESALASARSER